VPQDLARRLLESAGAVAVAMKMGNTRRLLAAYDMPIDVARHVDMRQVGVIGSIDDAFDTLTAGDGRLIRVVGEAPQHGEFIEIILPETPLRQAMLRYSGNILLVSLTISAISATLVYASLLLLFVRPMRRLTARMVAFGEKPEDPARIVEPSGRADEIGIAERELATMQRELAQTICATCSPPPSFSPTACPALPIRRCGGSRRG
jgi:hypothetical protein